MLYKHLNQQCKLYVELKSVLTNTHPVNIGLFATAMGMHYEKHWKKKLRITHTVTHWFLAIDAYPHVHICRPRAIQTNNNSNNNNKILYCVFWSWSNVLFFYKFILHVCFGLTVCWRLLVVVVTVVVYIAANECGAKSTKICANNKK